MVKIGFSSNAKVDEINLDFHLGQNGWRKLDFYQRPKWMK